MYAISINIFYVILLFGRYGVSDIYKCSRYTSPWNYGLSIYFGIQNITMFYETIVTI